MRNSLQPERVILRLATASDREHIYRLRHEIYAGELQQHEPRASGTLTDALDNTNEYFVALVNEVLLGFISVTPPGPGRFSVDKYLRREEFPDLLEPALYEIRLLTVLNPYRGRELALLLMYAALRWIEDRGGQRVVAIGRREVLGLYLRVGLQSLGCRFQSGAVRYELLTATVAQLNEALRKYTGIINRIERGVVWQLACPFRKPAACFHGGAFFNAIGTDFERLYRRGEIINADVLDAWFAPSPKVVQALEEDLGWILRTSPPSHCEGMLRAISAARQVPERSLIAGAGSSALIFLALRHWLTPESRVLILDPTYGEYAHVLEQVIRCRVDRLRLSRASGFEVDLNRLQTLLERGYDLVVLVNPNSPTGRHVPKAALEQVLRHAPETTRVWIDETYVEYAGPDQSLERVAAMSRNLVVCKSMSKVYALSGARAAYLCGPAPMMAELRAITPPWAVSLPAQIAATLALRDPDYYAPRYAETHRLREQLAAQLAAATDWIILPGTANFLLCFLPEGQLDARSVVQRCQEQGLFLRDAGAMGRRLGQYAVRIAVKDAATNARMADIIQQVCHRAQVSRVSSLLASQNSSKTQRAAATLVTTPAAA
jgi:histidinol-phosphate/aromatic aminotransferase/cobyric acid decarboxylase-like protein